jgi:hypothetical protein
MQGTEEAHETHQNSQSQDLASNPQPLEYVAGAPSFNYDISDVPHFLRAPSMNVGNPYSVSKVTVLQVGQPENQGSIPRDS